MILVARAAPGGLSYVGHVNPAQLAYQAGRAMMTGISLTLKIGRFLYDTFARWRAEGRFEEWAEVAKQRTDDAKSNLERLRDRP